MVSLPTVLALCQHNCVPASQVGSKNAAFFMGRAVKVCTKRAGDRKVHQLCIDAEKLEDRYRKQEVSGMLG